MSNRRGTSIATKLEMVRKLRVNRVLIAAVSIFTVSIAQAQNDPEKIETSEKPRAFEDSMTGTFRFGLGVGVQNYESRTGDSLLAPIFSLLADWNFGKALGISSGSFLGISTGIQLSGVRTVSTVTLPEESGTTLSQIPLVLEVGGSPLGDRFYFGLNGGARFLILTDSMSVRIGRSNPGVEVFPTLGGNLGLALGTSTSLMLRGDYTFTSADHLFDSVLSFNIGIS